ncbi:glycosyltransferase family 8 protein [Amniculicola lignicola CBS 123094]|uniref:Glycosyltransferase family 8 protein n=1 Tax=Amniculicola lignicola CBS 123094 TaxID=1392246 RepID=A0A6A5VUP8_9PLEO|nr:glycosyltransferase family 8 protein [Amniculicola lignicola CBS 123094]
MYSMHRYAHVGSPQKEGSPVRQPSVWLLIRKYKNLILAAFVSIALLATVHRRSSSPSSRTPYGYDVPYSDETSPYSSNIPANVQWSDYAYTQYVTNEIYLCNAVMVFDSLERLKSKADRVMMYPQEWTPELEKHNMTIIGRHMMKARERYGVKLVPVQVQSFEHQEPTWQASFTKLLAFDQTQYKRVINVDSDATILKSLDSLFFLPPTPLALPRAYWLPEKPHFLTSILLVITPSTFEFSRLQAAIKHHEPTDFDMEILNNLYGTSALVLPHREYGLLTRVLMGESRKEFLGSEEEVWDTEKVMKEVRYVHFSDWPVGKPWLGGFDMEVERVWPGCGGEMDCGDKGVWVRLRADFKRRREGICGREFA